MMKIDSKIPDVSKAATLEVCAPLLEAWKGDVGRGRCSQPQDADIIMWGSFPDFTTSNQPLSCGAAGDLSGMWDQSSQHLE